MATTRKRSTRKRTSSKARVSAAAGGAATARAGKKAASPDRNPAKGKPPVAGPEISAASAPASASSSSASPRGADGLAGTPLHAAPRVRLGKKDILDRVVERSGHRKRDVKPVVEAMLAVLGEALAAGEDLNLPPFGKLVVKREKENGNARILTCRIRQPKNRAGSSRTPLQGQDGQIK